MSWQYNQSTGELSRNGIRVATGYSGTGHGRNNPDAENLANVGPVPRGRYQIGPIHDTRTHGPPGYGTYTFSGQSNGWRAGFLIHGDNRRHDASTGCIILPRDIRERINASGDRVLEVVR